MNEFFQANILFQAIATVLIVGVAALGVLSQKR